MLLLLPVHLIVSAVAVTYAALLLVIIGGLLAWGSPLDPLRLFTFAFSGATLLQLALLAFLTVAWKWLWSAFPVLERVLFPNIEGTWKMTIDWQRDGREGQVRATASIRQTFLKLSMEVDSEGSESETLIAVPRRDGESGRPMLYYVYRVVPKKNKSDAGHPYEGSALLKLTDGNMLAGNYFTSRETKGRFQLRRS
jgi:hypothetical protein